jgi:hypothetical protein
MHVVLRVVGVVQVDDKLDVVHICPDQQTHRLQGMQGNTPIILNQQPCDSPLSSESQTCTIGHAHTLCMYSPVPYIKTDVATLVQVGGSQF